MNAESPFYQLGRGLAELVFSPDYRKGPWYVEFLGKKRLCRNYVTADAWARFLFRHGYRGLTIGKVYDISKFTHKARIRIGAD